MSVPAGSQPPGRADSQGHRPRNVPDLPRRDHYSPTMQCVAYGSACHTRPPTPNCTPAWCTSTRRGWSRHWAGSYSSGWRRAAGRVRDDAAAGAL